MAGKKSQPAKPVDTPTKFAEPQPIPVPEKGMIDSVRDIVSLFTALAVFFSIIGFVFWLRLITNQTTLFSFDSNPTAYIFYGIEVAALATIEYWFQFLLVLAVACVFFAIIAWQVRRTENKGTLKTLHIGELLSSFAAYIVAVIVIVFIGLGLIAASSPDSLSGVFAPSSSKQHIISLVFKDPIDPLVWHLLVDGTNTRRTQPLSLIFEYNDSLLVRDTKTGSVVKVSKDMLAGIVDDTQLAPAALPTITPTPMPTPTS